MGSFKLKVSKPSYLGIPEPLSRRTYVYLRSKGPSVDFIYDGYVESNAVDRPAYLGASLLNDSAGVEAEALKGVELATLLRLRQEFYIRAFHIIFPVR